MSIVEDKINDIRTNLMHKVEEMDDIKDAGIPFGCLDEYSSKIMNLIKNSEAYQNCQEFFVTTTKNSLERLKKFLESITPEDLPDGWDMDDIKNLLASLNIFEGSLDKFLEWTNHLSGLVNIEGFPDMQSLLNICNSMQKYLSCSGIELPQSKEQAKLAFGSLLLDSVETNATSQYIDSIERLMYNGNSCEDIIKELERNQLIYDTSVYRDQTNINDFMQTLINQNSSLNISGMNLYETGYDLMTSAIASDELKELLTA